MTTTPRSTAGNDETTVQQAKDTVRDVADQVKSVANEAAARLPEAAATTRDALVDAQRRIDSGSDETLSAGTLVAFGFALGLLVGGANRLLVMLALVPAAAMGLTLLDRQNPRPVPRPSTTR
jgi:molybdopterin converting factor small subunit